MEPYTVSEFNFEHSENVFFVIMYLLNAVISLLFGLCLLLPFMNSKMDQLTENNKSANLRDNPILIKLSVAAILAFLYILASTIKIIVQLTRNHNVFIVTRLIYHLLVLGIFNGYIAYTMFKEIRKKQDQNNQNNTCCTCMSIFRKFIDYCKKHDNIILFSSVNILSLALILLSLSVFPTLLLLFAHPENTFALIVIHIALFYTETVIGAYVIERLYRFTRLCTCTCCTSNTICCVRLWKTKNGYHQVPGHSYSTSIDKGPSQEKASSTSTGTSVEINAGTTSISFQRDQGTSAKSFHLRDYSKSETDEEDLQLSTKASDSQPEDKEKMKERTQEDTGTCAKDCLLFWGILALVIMLILVYFSLVWLYQFLILRNASSNVAFDMIIQYIPGVAIAALGFLVSKTSDKETIMNGKNAKRWLKLGELLDMDDKDLKKVQVLDENKKKQIESLQKVFKHDELLKKLTELQQTIESRFK